MNGAWTGTEHLMGFEMGGPRITIPVMWPSRSEILLTTDHQIMFKALLEQLPPTMAAVEQRPYTMATEETGETRIEAVPSMAAKVLRP